MDAVRDQDEVADAFRMGLLPREVAHGLLVIRRPAERGDPHPGLEVERGTSPDEVVHRGSVPQTQVLTLLEHAERRDGVADDVVVEALQLMVGDPLVDDPSEAMVAGGLRWKERRR